jgi:CubicO group peptidase (beta-lactamase class C family)
MVGTLARALALLLAGGGLARADGLDRLVRPLAQPLVTSGAAVGVGVAVIRVGRPTRYFTYGAAALTDTGSRPFTPDTLFQIGSVTKVFTTNLLGQAVREGRWRLNQPLATFRRQLGPLQPMTGAVTLAQLGSFTGGMADLAPLCLQEAVPGCLPSPRPTPGDYPGQAFAAFFRATLPTDYDMVPPQPAAALPAPYFYSDFSTGLIGLLLGTAPGERLTNAALRGWQTELDRRLLRPLGMRRTFLRLPQGTRDVARGYETALAGAQVVAGQIAGVTLASPGGLYAGAPLVQVRGGGGTGAAITASVSDCAVSGLTIAAPGSGYTAPATVIFSGAGATTEAKAVVRIEAGRVAAVAVIDGGAGYFRTPQVTIAGGRTAGGADATATALIANGQVVHVQVDAPGAGYLPPLSIAIAPGDAAVNAVPIWGPAGALSSTLRDMGRFATAALGERQVEGRKVPPTLSAGFAIAQRAYACGAGAPALATCPAFQTRSGLAWEVEPADPPNDQPAVLAKNGGIDGFSTELMLMPAQGLAVVAFVNTRSIDRATGQPERPAVPIARNVIQSLLRGPPG